MMGAGAAEMLLGALIAAAAGGLALWALGHFLKSNRAASGRPYADVVDELYRETERRGDLLAAYAATREARIARLERR